MGERGPLRTPNASRRRGKDIGSMRVVVARPPMPRTFTGEAKAEWKRIVPELEKMGFLATVDRSVLIRYCRAWADWCKIDENLSASGLLVSGRHSGLVRNPLWMMRSDIEATLSDLGKQLGLTPTARVRAGVVHRQEFADVPERAATFAPAAEFDIKRVLRAVK